MITLAEIEGHMEYLGEAKTQERLRRANKEGFCFISLEDVPADEVEFIPLNGYSVPVHPRFAQ